jgi:hypothetical protein
VTLVTAIERGVNGHEIGDIIEFGLAHPAVRSVSFLPVTHSGRHPQFDPLTRLTSSDVIEFIAAQRPGWFREDDFFPVPCCFPACRSVTYLLTEGTAGQPGFGVLPVPRLLQVEDYLDYVSNRVVPDYAVREALEKLWSASALIGTETTEEQLRAAAEALDCADACRGEPAGGDREPDRPRVHDRRPGLPGPVHPQRPASGTGGSTGCGSPTARTCPSCAHGGCSSARASRTPSPDCSVSRECS